MDEVIQPSTAGGFVPVTPQAEATARQDPDSFAESESEGEETEVRQLEQESADITVGPRPAGMSAAMMQALDSTGGMQLDYPQLKVPLRRADTRAVQRA